MKTGLLNSCQSFQDAQEPDDQPSSKSFLPIKRP
jgi:hypothetical protein